MTIPSHRRPRRPFRVPVPLVLGIVAFCALLAAVVAFVAGRRGDWTGGYMIAGGLAPASIFLLGIAIGAAMAGDDRPT